MKSLSYAFFGCTIYSKKLLNFLIKKKFIPKIIFSSPNLFNISYNDKKVKNYNYANLQNVAEKYKIPLYEIDSIDGKRTKDYETKIKKFDLDLILVLGWYYMLPKSTRELSKLGAWGLHASLLPNYAGGAPLVWAMIKGEKKTGVTLLRLEDGIDDGDIISQKTFLIKESDTIKEVYEKATAASMKILLEALENIKNIKYTPQDKKKIKIYPQRKPKDGEIDLTKSADEIYNFVRAQSSPYPGAFIRGGDGKKLIIEKIRKDKNK
jgi:methionyl-tRNA formyltransferase